MMEVTWEDIDKETGRAWQHRILEWAENEGYLDMDVSITLVAGSMKRETFERELSHMEYPGDDTFRAFTIHGVKQRVFLFVDESETDESIWWLLAHELAHVTLRESPFLFGAIERQKAEWLAVLGLTRDEYMTNAELMTRDNIHESDPEEVFCNMIATAYMGGRDYSRKWWRQRRAELGLEVA